MIRSAWRWWTRRRDDPREQLFAVCVRLDEARRYVDRDRAIERRERDRLIQQRQAARERVGELETLLRQYLLGQSILDADHAHAAIRGAREALASDFGSFDDTAPPERRTVPP